jgi:hypothetical protein
MDQASSFEETQTACHGRPAFRPGEILCCSDFSHDIQTGNSTRE